LREKQRRVAVDQSRSEALTGIMGARRAFTVSMISPLIDALEVDGGNAEVAVSELALDDDQRHAFARHSTAWAGAGVGAARSGAALRPRRRCAATRRVPRPVTSAGRR
jgi:hypothetical protein